MKRLLLPLLAVLALPTAVNAENYKLYNPKIESPDAFINTGTVYLIITKTQAMEKIPMNNMAQCEAMGKFWKKNATSFAHWVCLYGKSEE